MKNEAINSQKTTTRPVTARGLTGNQTRLFQLDEIGQKPAVLISPLERNIKYLQNYFLSYSR